MTKAKATLASLVDETMTQPCEMPSLDVDPASGLDPVLYAGPTSPSKRLFHRKPPHLDRAREYEAHAKSHLAARVTVSMLSDRHREREIEKEEAFERETKRDKFRTTFVETRLATCGQPTLNTMDVRIARQREAIARNQTGAKTKRATSVESRIASAIRQAYGSRELDLKALELVHIPSQVYSTLLLQLGRFIARVNVSRNALREVPESFVVAFPQVKSVNYKENALDLLPECMDKLTHLTELNAECNQLRKLPLRLPSTLQRLILSRNRLARVPHIHSLIHLTELDLSHNHLQLLPPGMTFLGKLTRLVVSSNRLVTLALLPRFVIPEKKPTNDGEDDGSDGDDDSQWTSERIELEQKKWRVETDPLTGETVYYHVVDQRVSRVKPKCFRNIVPMLAIGKTASTLQHKKTHAQVLNVFPDGWEVTLGGVCINRHDSSSGVHDTRPETAGIDGAELQSMTLSFTHHLTDTSYISVPPPLDKWGDLHRIQSLHLGGNQLVGLPSSIGKLVWLKLLDLENNKILALPDTFHEMVALETAKLSMNALSWLPPSFCGLPNLTDLDLKLNRFVGLPDEIGSLARLRTLDLSSNNLASLPKSMLALKKLATLRLQGNQTLVTSGLIRPETLASGDIPQVFWHLDHQLITEQQRGGQLPPASKSQTVGVGDEVWSTSHHVHRAFTQAIARAQMSLSLDFHWKHLGFTQFPTSFFTSLDGLRELRLSGQQLETIPAAFSRVCASLRILQLRKNKIRQLEDDVFDCGSLPCLPLEELDVEYNQLESLPVSIGNLATLKVLRASNNRLTHLLPESFAKLTTLRDLHLAHNRFSHPSPTFSSLTALERFDLSYNQLETLATMTFVPLQRLTQVRVSVNALTDLPEDLAQAPIEELFLAGNKLDSLPKTVLLLKSTLRILRMQSNKILRLPLEFGELRALEVVEADGNPFRSPPPEIMTLGIRAIRAYLHKRHQRVDETQRLLRTAHFAFHEGEFAEPQLGQLLVRDPTNENAVKALQFLTDKHLKAFERAVDSYINGAFYLLPSTLRGADLVTEFLLQKQFYLAQRHRESVLRDLMKLCALIREKKWLDKVDFRYDLERPWGRLGELCGVYALNPRALYDDSSQLPSVMSVIKKRVYHGFEDEAFDHSEDVVCDAIEHYVGVYGPVGVVHDDVPFKCGCEDLLRFNKKHEPCYRPGWSFVQVVYTQEEADRRVRDEETVRTALDALRPQVETFLKTQEGEKRFHKEVKIIKDNLRLELKSKKKRLKFMQTKYKKLKADLEKEKKQEEQAKLDMTKLTLAEVNERAEREAKVKTLGERVEDAKKEYQKGKTQLGQGYDAFLDDVVTLLIQKIGVEVRNHLIQQQRQKAIEFGLRRPWDGPNGRDFELYKQLVRRKMLGDGTMEQEDGEGNTPQAGGNLADDAASDNSEISDVSFDGYDDFVSNLAPQVGEKGGDDDDLDDDDDDGEEDTADEARAAALANLEVSDVSEDDEVLGSGGRRKAVESEDSDL